MEGRKRKGRGEERGRTGKRKEESGKKEKGRKEEGRESGKKEKRKEEGEERTRDWGGGEEDVLIVNLVASGIT